LKLSLNNFLYGIKQIVTGGGQEVHGSNLVPNDGGFIVDRPLILETIAPVSVIGALVDSSGGTFGGTLSASLTSAAAGTPIGSRVLADATATFSQTITNNNIATIAAVLSTLTNDVATLASKINSLAAGTQLTTTETNSAAIVIAASTTAVGTVVIPIPRDYDEASDYFKIRINADQVTQVTDTNDILTVTAYIKRGTAALGTAIAVATTTPLATGAQWIGFDFSGHGFLRDDIVDFVITIANNATAGEEARIRAIEYSYRSTLVSYHETDGVLDGMRGDLLR
jgi:hypothetical protein